jgi:hypothetical protein
MLQALHAFGIAAPYNVEVIDVDENPELVAQYDELVPVLLVSRAGEPPTQLCHYFLDHGALRRFIESS